MVRKTGKKKEGWDGKKRRDVVAIVLFLTPKLDFPLIQYPNPGAVYKASRGRPHHWHQIPGRFVSAGP